MITSVLVSFATHDYLLLIGSGDLFVAKLTLKRKLRYLKHQKTVDKRIKRIVDEFLNLTDNDASYILIPDLCFNKKRCENTLSYKVIFYNSGDRNLIEHWRQHTKSNWKNLFIGSDLQREQLDLDHKKIFSLKGMILDKGHLKYDNITPILYKSTNTCIKNISNILKSSQGCDFVDCSTNYTI